MNKQLVLRKFIENKSNYLSGEEISRELHISRAAVWKIIGSLKDDGFAFDSKNNKGYRLVAYPEIADKFLISELLGNGFSNTELIVLNDTDSTNTYAKTLAPGRNLPFAIISLEQKKGRGRYARSFFSPPGKGLYLTAVIKPKANLEQIPTLTVLTAVYVCEVLEELCGVHSKIKWINDIFLNNKKLCGILCEAGICAETKSADFVAIGIGINLKGKSEEFPEELRNTATSLENEGAVVNINILAAELLKRLYTLETADLEKLMNEKIDDYRKRIFVLGKKIFVLKQEGSIPATALDVDKDGRLKVEYEDGKIEFLNSGEISIKYC